MWIATVEEVLSRGMLTVWVSNQSSPKGGRVKPWAKGFDVAHGCGKRGSEPEGRQPFGAQIVAWKFRHFVGRWVTR